MIVIGDEVSGVVVGKVIEITHDLFTKKILCLIEIRDTAGGFICLARVPMDNLSLVKAGPVRRAHEQFSQERGAGCD